MPDHTIALAKREVLERIAKAMDMEPEKAKSITVDELVEAVRDLIRKANKQHCEIGDPNVPDAFRGLFAQDTE